MAQGGARIAVTEREIDSLQWHREEIRCSGIGRG